MEVSSPSETEAFARVFGEIHANVEGFIRGKSDVVRMALVCFMAEGHLLIDDVPGVGKTSLARAIAASIDGSMKRIQFTPDLLPSDVTGTMIYHQGRQEFEFHPGGVFANIVIADEINRASPKTQSALLEVMEEGHVTIDSRAYDVGSPFMVIATQNPVEFDGTYHLPEAQIDRFMMKISIGYPDHAAEVEVLANRALQITPEDLAAVVPISDVERMIDIVRRTYVAPALLDYCTSVVAQTRRMDDKLRLGVSPRGSLSLVLAGRAFAASCGRNYVTADDVKLVAPYVLPHRMLLTPEAQLTEETPERLLAGVLASVPVPQSRAEA